MENLKIREFQVSLRKYIETSDISLEVKRIILSDILRDIEYQANQKIMEEIEKRNQEEVDKDAKSI